MSQILMMEKVRLFQLIFFLKSKQLIMNYYDPFTDPIQLPSQSSQHSKKYSLRKRFQNPLQPPHRSRAFRQNNLSTQQASQDIRIQELPWNPITQLSQQSFSFNCIESAHRILDFNHVTSVQVKNHTKTLSTTPSFQNPFAYHQRTTKEGRNVEEEGRKLATKKSMVFSKKDLHISNQKSYKTSLSYKNSNNSQKLHSNGRLQTEINSQPLSTVHYYPDYGETGSEKDRKGKISLKHVNKMPQKPQLLICLNYTDLKQPQQSRLQKYAGRLICSNQRGAKAGCNCQPKCFWVDQWLSIAGDVDIGGRSFSQEWQSVLRQVEKDIPRTQPYHQTFQMQEYQDSLREVLLGYARIDPEVGYVQGMNFIAAGLVYHARSGFQALQIMTYLMIRCNFRQLVLKDLLLSHELARGCNFELKRLSYDLWEHLNYEGVQVEIFITGWYFSLMGAFVPLESMHHIIDRFLKHQFQGINQIILTMLIYLKAHLLNLSDHQLMLAFSNTQISQTAKEIDWGQLVARSQNLLLKPLLQ